MDANTEVSSVAPEGPNDLQERASGLLKPFDVDALAERLAIIQEAKKRCMTQGVHFGPAFGKNAKDTLLKPGAEVLCQIFGLGQHLKVTERLLEGNHVIYTVRVTVYDMEGGLRVIRGYGNGCCTTMEHKYRKQTEPRKGDDGKVYPPSYTPYDFYNVCLKIAEKRSYVDGAIRATGASAIFTQDCDEDPEKFRALNGEGSDGHARPQVTKPNGKHTAPPVASTTLQGTVSGYETREANGKTYHAALIGEAKAYTDDAKLGRVLKGLQGLSASVSATPSKKPGLHQLVGIHAVNDPLADRTARRQVTKAKHDAPPKPAATFAPHDDIPMGDRTPYEDLQQRLLQADIAEYWVIKAVKRLGWASEDTQRLADLGPKGLGILLTRWTDALSAARAEEQGIEQEAAA
jgi:hypothetical protein